uniref:Ectopic P granules protein 5 homolog n=1 Tax=Branchiostoma floridae TaxID=7739 RepID=C3XZQ8_BRAFL|eukprot:XP_002610446.1 hypothetical protein BRAFLDRAFT_124263 [Branchiostoma floridae]
MLGPPLAPDHENDSNNEDSTSYCTNNRTKENRFLKVVEKVIQSDHSLTSSNMGPHCKLLCSMIQVQSGFVSARVSSTTVLELWVRLLTSLPQWWYNTQVLQVLDSLLQTAFRCKGGEDMTISILYDRYKALLSTKTDPGVLVSLVSWMSSSAGPPTFLDKPTQSDVWVAYQVLQAESMWEEDTQLRKMLENALQQDSNISVDGAVKNVSSELHLPSAPPLHRLMIYRWAQQALATPLDHPLLPLVWQRFFQIYLHRPAADSGLAGRGGVGHRFFQAHSQSSLLKKLKKRLQEAADFHYAASKTPAMTLDLASETDPALKITLRGLFRRIKEKNPWFQAPILQECIMTYPNEPRLHDPNLYLPALPQQYDAERLLSLFKNSQDTWLEFVDMDRVERDIAVMATEWIQHRQVKTAATSRPSPDFSLPATSPMERHLMTSDLTQPPPSAGEQEPPVPDVPPQVLEDTTLLLATVEPHLQHLLHQARMFTEREQRHLTLDNTYLDLIPDHFHNKHVSLTLQIPCHSSFSLNSPTCKGPAQITLQEFIGKNPDEAGKLLQATLAAPALCGLLGPHFSPNQAGVAFINMYTDVTRVPDSHGVDLAFMLLTKASLAAQQDHSCLLQYCKCGHGSDSKELSPLCWKNTLRTLGCAEMGSTADSVTLASLTPEQVTETLGWLSSHYMKLRAGSQQLTVNGLYCELQGYVQHIAQLLALLFTTLLQTEPGGAVVPSQNFESDVENLWALLQSAYEPWIASLDAAKLGSSSIPSGVGLCMPWTEKECELAAGVMDNFTNCLQLLFTKYKGTLPTHSQDVLALTWRYYASLLARSDQPHLLEECHPVCQSFLCSVFIRLDCVTMVSDYCSHDLPEIVARLHECLLHLLVHFSVQEGEVVSGRIQEAEQFGWHFLSAAAYQNTMSWLVDAANSDLVLFLGQPAPQPIRLMKIAAGFKPEIQVQYGDASRKQQLYVHGVVELVCRCVARRKVNISCYQPVITGLLGDIESLAGSALDSHQQHSQMVALLSEALGLLNNCPPDERKVETLARFFWEWLESNSCSCLVLPMVTAGCRTLASPAHMARMVECGIEVFLNSGLEENVQSGWDQVLAAVEIPELAQEDFLSECLQHGCYLTLYAYVLQRLPMCQVPKDEMALADQLLSWTAAAKPRADNEAKLLLWWWQVLRICLQHVDRNQPLKDVFCALMNLTSSLTTLGEDKSAAGLLGALGLGKRSPLSHRFRLVCRGLSTFLLAQARSVSFLRLQPGDPHAVGQVQSGPLPSMLPVTEGASPKAVQSLANLESLQTNKQYSSLKSHIQYIYGFTVDPLHTLRDAPPLLAHLSKVLFQDQNYLSLLHIQAQGTYGR